MFVNVFIFILWMEAILSGGIKRKIITIFRFLKSSIHLSIISLIILSVIISGFFTGCVAAGSGTAAKFPSAVTDELDFTLKDLSGNSITLSGLKGKIVVVNFWATWCGPCKAEIPDFIEVYAQYRDKNVEFLGISQENINDVRSFAGDFHINYPILIDEDGSVSNSWNVRAIPATFIIDKEGNIISGQVGTLAKSRLIPGIENALNK